MDDYVVEQLRWKMWYLSFPCCFQFCNFLFWFLLDVFYLWFSLCSFSECLCDAYHAVYVFHAWYFFLAIDMIAQLCLQKQINAVTNVIINFTKTKIKITINTKIQIMIKVMKSIKIKRIKIMINVINQKVLNHQNFPAEVTSCFRWFYYGIFGAWCKFVWF